MYGLTVQTEMKIRSIRHRGLKRLVLKGDDREIRPDMVKRIQNVLTILMAAKSPVGARLSGLAPSRTFGRPKGDLEHFGYRQLAHHVRARRATRSAIWTWRTTTDGHQDRHEAVPPRRHSQGRDTRSARSHRGPRGAKCSACDAPRYPISSTARPRSRPRWRSGSRKRSASAWTRCFAYRPGTTFTRCALRQTVSTSSGSASAPRGHRSELRR